MSLCMISAYFLRPPLPLSLGLPDLVVLSGLGPEDAVAAAFSLSVRKTYYRCKLKIAMQVEGLKSKQRIH